MSSGLGRSSEGSEQGYQDTAFHQAQSCGVSQPKIVDTLYAVISIEALAAYWVHTYLECESKPPALYLRRWVATVPDCQN